MGGDEYLFTNHDGLLMLPHGGNVAITVSKLIPLTCPTPLGGVLVWCALCGAALDDEINQSLLYQRPVWALLTHFSALSEAYPHCAPQSTPFPFPPTLNLGVCVPSPPSPLSSPPSPHPAGESPLLGATPPALPCPRVTIQLKYMLDS